MVEDCSWALVDLIILRYNAAIHTPVFFGDTQIECGDDGPFHVGLLSENGDAAIVNGLLVPLGPRV